MNEQQNENNISPWTERVQLEISRKDTYQDEDINHINDNFSEEKFKIDEHLIELNFSKLCTWKEKVVSFAKYRRK